jgi:hypothetical protein
MATVYSRMLARSSVWGGHAADGVDHNEDPAVPFRAMRAHAFWLQNGFSAGSGRRVVGETSLKLSGSQCGIRTRLTAVRGRRPGPMQKAAGRVPSQGLHRCARSAGGGYPLPLPFPHFVAPVPSDGTGSAGQMPASASRCQPVPPSDDPFVCRMFARGHLGGSSAGLQARKSPAPERKQAGGPQGSRAPDLRRANASTYVSRYREVPLSAVLSVQGRAGLSASSAEHRGVTLRSFARRLPRSRTRSEHRPRPTAHPRRRPRQVAAGDA